MVAKILLVDDEPRIEKLVRDMVEGAGYEFAYAENGADALALVGRIAPDLVIMDVMMPKMDGFTACRELRARGVTVPGVAARAAKILNSFGVSATGLPPRVARCWAMSSSRRPTAMVPVAGAATGRMAARRRCASMCIMSSRGSKGFTM